MTANRKIFGYAAWNMCGLEIEDDEKRRQVGLMARIYSSAKVVANWLGSIENIVESLSFSSSLPTTTMPYHRSKRGHI